MEDSARTTALLSMVSVLIFRTFGRGRFRNKTFRARTGDWGFSTLENGLRNGIPFFQADGGDFSPKRIVYLDCSWPLGVFRFIAFFPAPPLSVFQCLFSSYAWSRNVSLLSGTARIWGIFKERMVSKSLPGLPGIKLSELWRCFERLFLRFRLP